MATRPDARSRSVLPITERDPGEALYDVGVDDDLIDPQERLEIVMDRR